MVRELLFQCCGDFPTVGDVLVTLDVHYEEAGPKRNVSIQTGTAQSRT